MADEIEDADYRTLAEFRFELRRFQSFSEQAARSAGLTPQQHQALLAVRAAGDTGMLVGDLAERLLLRPHSASELVRRLVEHGLATREHIDADRRQVRIALTENARSVLASLSYSHRNELRRLRPLLKGMLEAL